MDVCELYNIDFRIVSLDQGKAFERVDHIFHFSTLRAFGFGNVFCQFWVCCMGCSLCGEGGWWAELPRQGPERK